jgi:hypothetical protein
MISNSKVTKGSRVLFGIRCSLYKTREGEKKVQFNLKYLRYLEKYLGGGGGRRRRAE